MKSLGYSSFPCGDGFGEVLPASGINGHGPGNGHHLQNSTTTRTSPLGGGCRETSLGGDGAREAASVEEVSTYRSRREQTRTRG